MLNESKRINVTKNFLWSEVEVRFDKELGAYTTECVGGIYHICLENTTGSIHELFESDLVNGPDRFLVAVYDISPGEYKFEMIMNMDGFDIDDFRAYAEHLAAVVVRKNPEYPIVMSIR